MDGRAKTKEELEVVQKELNEKRQQWLDLSDERTKENHAAVSAASELLTKATIPFFLFPLMRNPKNLQEVGFWQFNNIPEIIGFGADGKPDETMLITYRQVALTLFDFVLKNYGIDTLADPVKGVKEIGQLYAWLLVTCGMADPDLFKDTLPKDIGPEWSQYKRKGLSEMRPYKPGDDLTGVSISEADRNNGSPKEGDMIARNPKNHEDKWLVAKKYFEDNLEPA